MPTSILRFSSQQPALLLQAYYKTQGIESLVNQTDDGFDLLVEDEKDIEVAIAYAKEFLNQPQAEKFQAAAWESGAISEHNAPLFKGFVVENLAQWRNQWFTALTTLLCIALYLLMQVGFADIIYNGLKMRQLPELLETYQWWRVIGPNLMHANAMHLLFNMAGWWFFAGMMERYFGSTVTIVLFLFSSIFTNIIYTAMWGPNFLGLSGILFAVFGFLWWIGILRPQWGLVLPKSIVIMFLISLALGFSGLLGPNISNAGHTLGLVSGILMALAMHQFSPAKRKANKVA